MRQAAAEYGAANSGAAARRLRNWAVNSAGLQQVQQFIVKTFGSLGDGALQVLYTAWQWLQERWSDSRGWNGVWQLQRWLLEVRLFPSSFIVMILFGQHGFVMRF